MIHENSYAKQVDTWALGMLLYEFLHGSAAFESKEAQETYKKIKFADVKFLDDVSPDARDLINNMLNKDPNKRFGLVSRVVCLWSKTSRNDDDDGTST